MKIKIAIVILAAACLALGIALYTTKQQGDAQHVKDAGAITDFSNQLSDVNLQLVNLGQVNLALTNDLAASRAEAVRISNNLVAINITLTNTQNTMAASLTSAQEQITNLNSQISDLEAQNKELDQRATDLTNAIAQLNAIIADTQNKLATSETNNVYLQDQLKQQMAQRAELERRFNDLTEIRNQYKKLKNEAYVARRIELDKHNNTDKKGGQMLIERSHPAPPTTQQLYNLNVEVGSDGSVKVIPPIAGATNAPTQ
jgi:chromosome segregation ATPase